MNITKFIKIAILTLLGLGIPDDVRSQVYTLSIPVNGSLSLGATDLSPDAFSGNRGGLSLGLGTLTLTIYIDPVGQTIRQVGSVSVTASALQFALEETQVHPRFPLAVTNTGEITITITSFPTNFSFDTGVRPMTFDPNLGIYKFNGILQLDTGYFSGNYSLLTGGQTLGGEFTYGLDSVPNNPPPLSTFTSLSPTGYPGSVSLDGLWAINALMKATPRPVADVTATNGFHMVLSPCTYNNIWEYWNWSSGPVVATLAATNAPMLISQPQGQIVHAHTNVHFTVTAAGVGPLAYQWAFNGSDISGATSSALTISNVTPPALGNYSVTVTNIFGRIISSNASLSMYPFLTVPFTGAIANWGKDATLSVEAWGTGPLSFQWFKDGLALTEATNQVLTLHSVQSTNAGLYSIVVSSALGSVTNTPAMLVVNAAGVSLGLYPGLIIDGVVGYKYVIQRTADLTDTNSWVTMTNITLVQPLQLWVDTNVDASLPANSRHFYQVLPGQ